MPLKLYTTPGIPNPDVVHVYMAHCGIGRDKVEWHLVRAGTRACSPRRSFRAECIG